MIRKYYTVNISYKVYMYSSFQKHVKTSLGSAISTTETHKFLQLSISISVKKYYPFDFLT